jgi:hypothetical protein
MQNAKAKGKRRLPLTFSLLPSKKCFSESCESLFLQPASQKAAVMVLAR